MKTLSYGAWIAVVVIAGLLLPSARAQTVDRQTDRERLIGAWHLEHIELPGSDGKPSDIP